jgi:hypothetical protein
VLTILLSWIDRGLICGWPEQPTLLSNANDEHFSQPSIEVSNYLWAEKIPIQMAKTDNHPAPENEVNTEPKLEVNFTHPHAMWASRFQQIHFLNFSHQSQISEKIIFQWGASDNNETTSDSSRTCWILSWPVLHCLLALWGQAGKNEL